MILGMSWFHPILATLFATVAVLLMLVILLQRGRGVGLSGAFGGAGGHSTLGARTGDVLTWVTMIGAGLFVLLAVGLNYAFIPDTASATPPAAPTAPADQNAPAEGAPPGEGSGGAWQVTDPDRAPRYAWVTWDCLDVDWT
jgi:preprotein translocase subunit SecG